MTKLRSRAALRLDIFIEILLAEIGDERVPYPFRSRMAKVELCQVRVKLAKALKVKPEDFDFA